MDLASYIRSIGTPAPGQGLSQVMQSPGPAVESPALADAKRQRFMELFGADPQAPDFQSQAMGNFLRQAGPTVAGAVAPGIGQALGKAMQVAPKLTGIGLGGAGAMIPTQTQDVEAAKVARPDPANPVVQLQQQLQASGDYKGSLDGVMGPETQAAVESFRAKQQAQQAQATEGTKAQAELERARAATAETARLAAAAEQEAARKSQGDQRVKDAEGNVSGVSRFLRDYGGPMGWAAGGLAGLLARRGVVGSSNATSAETANRANAVITPRGTDVPARVGQVNQFWSEGQPRGIMGGAPEAPFNVAPRVARGFAPNPDAPPASALYQPDRMKNLATDAAVPAAGMAEWGVADKVMGGRARDELKTAQIGRAHV